MRRVAAVLSAGGVAVLPTDTIYGFHCVASRPASVLRIRRLKGKEKGAGFILLASRILMLDEVVDRWPGSSRTLLSSVWPAPLTAVLPARKGLSAALAPLGKVAVRVPSHRGLRSLIDLVGEPVVSTSVNLSGCEPLGRIADIKKTFPGLDAYISRTGRHGGSSSTVVDFTLREPRLLRAGSYPFERIGRTEAAARPKGGDRSR